MEPIGLTPPALSVITYEAVLENSASPVQEHTQEWNEPPCGFMCWQSLNCFKHPLVIKACSSAASVPLNVLSTVSAVAATSGGESRRTRQWSSQVCWMPSDQTGPAARWSLFACLPLVSSLSVCLFQQLCSVVEQIHRRQTSCDPLHSLSLFVFSPLS